MRPNKPKSKSKKKRKVKRSKSLSRQQSSGSLKRRKASKSSLKRSKSKQVELFLSESGVNPSQCQKSISNAEVRDELSETEKKRLQWEQIVKFPGRSLPSILNTVDTKSVSEVVSNYQEEDLERLSDTTSNWETSDEDENNSENESRLVGPSISRINIRHPKTVEENFDYIYKISNDGVWNANGIDPDKVLQDLATESVENIFEHSEFEYAKQNSNSKVNFLKIIPSTNSFYHKVILACCSRKLGPIERRIQIENQKFKVIPNEINKSKTLYRAISRAVTGLESNYKSVQKAILSELCRDWFSYHTQMGEQCGYSAENLPSVSKLLTQYKSHFSSSKHIPSAFELKAASKVYKFNYVLIDGHNYEGTATVQNSKNEELLETVPEFTYHFLKTGILPQDWRYEFIIPLGPPQTPEDGVYPIAMYDVILIDRPFDLDKKSKRKTEDQLKLTKTPILCFGLDHRLFFYKPSHTHDLWSLLSELLFKTIGFAPAIYESVLRAKLHESTFYHFSKLKKRQLKGRNRDEKLRKQYVKSLKIPHLHRGDTLDLDHAASFLNFSYTLIGLDGNGNFFWKESIGTLSPVDQKRINLSLFVRLMKNKECYWYSLECIGWNDADVMEQQMYRDVTFLGSNKDTGCDRTLYYRARPCSRVDTAKPVKKPNKSQSRTQSTWGLILSSVKVGRRWLTSSVSRLFEASTSRVNSVAHNISSASIGFFNQLRGWLRLLKRTPKVNPEQSVKPMFYRDNP